MPFGPESNTVVCTSNMLDVWQCVSVATFGFRRTWREPQLLSDDLATSSALMAVQRSDGLIEVGLSVVVSVSNKRSCVCFTRRSISLQYVLERTEVNLSDMDIRMSGHST